MSRKVKKPILSICIPNYNRADFLTKNLQLIAKQNHPNIEVVVCDDFSIEDIQMVVDNFRKNYPKVNLKYKQNSRNLGFDKNVLKTISLASGQYCWLLSNDDQILPGSIKKIIKTINRNPDTALFLVNYQRFDKILKKITAETMISIKKDCKFDDASKFFFFETPKSFFKFLGPNCLTMSVDVFKRQYWQKMVPSVSQYIGHNFIHLFIIASIIKKHPKIYFISEPQLRYTANNHRVWNNIIWHDIRNYFLKHLSDLNYDKKQIDNFKKVSKKDEFNERILVLSQFSPKLYRFLFPTIRKIRLFLGHHV